MFRIHQLVFHAVFQNFRKYLFKKIGIFKTAGIILPKSREMRNWVQHIQSKEPPVSNIYFDFLYGLAHTLDAIKILNKWNFNKHDRIHAWASIIRAVFFFHKIIDEVPIDRLIDQSQHMVLRNHVIHAEHQHLFSFLICIFCHHKKYRLSDTSIVPEKRFEV